MTPKLIASTLVAATLSAGAAHAGSTTLNMGGSSLAAPTYFSEFSTYTAAKPSILFSYAAVGSGGGQSAFINNTITSFENPPAGTLTYGTIVGTIVDVGASDAFLSASQLSNPATGSYVGTNASSSVDGPLIQIPTFGTPITMAYNESLQTKTLTLTDSQICGVLSGKITDWHTLNSAIPANTAITVVYRSDGSGTSFLTTQHLNAVCTAANSNFPTIPVAITKTFASLFTNSTPPANFIGESGSANVATELLATTGGFGYLSPDYTSIAPNSSNTTSLKVASLVNATNNTAYAPTVSNTETGLGNAGPGSTDATPPSTLTAAMDPLNWVPAIPTTKKGYPIVGYTTMDLSSCYFNKTAGSALIGFLNDQYKISAYVTIIKNDGFVPLNNSAAVKYVAAVANTFLSNETGFGLDIDDKTTCASYTGR